MGLVDPRDGQVGGRSTQRGSDSMPGCAKRLGAVKHPVAAPGGSCEGPSCDLLGSCDLPSLKNMLNKNPLLSLKRNSSLITGCFGSSGLNQMEEFAVFGLAGFRFSPRPVKQIAETQETSEGQDDPKAILRALNHGTNGVAKPQPMPQMPQMQSRLDSARFKPRLSDVGFGMLSHQDQTP